MNVTTLDPMADFAPDGVVEIDPLRGASLPDAALCEDVAAAIARPKKDEADSFVLHAPLELLARAALLSLVHPESRDRARARLAWLRAAWEAAGPEAPPSEGRRYDGATEARDHLADAIAAGDLDAADADARWLAESCAPVDLVPLLADLVLPRLSAAGHGPIFLYQLRRVAPRSRAAAGALRGLVRELARAPSWQLSWQLHAGHDGRSGAACRDDGGRELVAALRRPPSPGDPGSDFIFPTMSLVERSGLAAELLTGPTASLDPATASRVLARIAAWSMLQDDPDHAPYGWSHCLSMPQAVLGIADACSDPRAAVRVAATFSLGFRATQGRAALDAEWRPVPGGEPKTPAGALTATPGEAASAAWYATGAAKREWITTLATRAAIHPDAHLAKYTLACLDAAAADPAAERLHLAAAAFLSAWWAQFPATDGPHAS